MKKPIVLLLALALMLTALPCGVFADDANLYFAGKGTAEEPYLIQTPEDLAKLVYLTNENYQDKGLYSTTAEIIIPDTTTKWEGSGRTGWYASRPGSGSLVRYYKMTADLDMTGYDFSQGGIGGENSYSRFRGSFDGNGHIIKNWNGYSTAGSDNNAIFTNVSFGEYEDQGIKNLGIENAKIKSSNHVCGILAGMCTAGGQAENSGFENCFVKNSESTVSTRSGTGPASGGIVGKVHLPYTGSTTINIKNCYVKNTSLYCGCAGDPAEHRHFDIGGIVGRVAMDDVSGGHKCFITNCYSIGVSGNESLYAIGVLSGPTSLSLITDFSNCYSVDEEKADTWSLLKFDAINKAFIAEKTGLPAPKSTDFAAGRFNDDVLEANNGLPVLPWEYTYITNTLETPENGTLDVTEEAGLVKRTGNTVYIKTGADLTVSAQPAENYALSAVRYGGADKTSDFGVSGSAKFAFSDLSEGGVWSAEFAKEATEPSIVAEKTVVMSTYGDGNAPAAVAYARFIGVNPFEYGMVITRASDGKALTLKALENKSGAYAIKVFGEGVKTGSFTMKPYYIATEGEASTFGNETDSFTLE